MVAHGIGQAGGAELKKTDNRVAWVDTAKFFGMMLVIAGHHEAFGDLGRSVIFSFHMPLFFFLTGLFERKREMFQVIKRGGISYLIPYAILVVLSAFTAGWLRGTWFGAWGVENYEMDWILKSSFAYGNGWSLMWFLPCLFTASVLMELLFFLVRNDWIRGILILVINVVTALYIPGPLYWELHEALMALLFLYLGYLVRTYLLDENLRLKESVRKSGWFYGELMVAAGFWIYCVGKRYYVNMVRPSYPAYPLSVVAAVCGIEIFLLLMAMLPANGFMMKMGSSSLVIYMVHCLEHNLIPWDVINEKVSLMLAVPLAGVRVTTLLVRIVLILAVTAVIVKIKEKLTKRG